MKQVIIFGLMILLLVGAVSAVDCVISSGKYNLKDGNTCDLKINDKVVAVITADNGEAEFTWDDTNHLSFSDEHLIIEFDKTKLAETDFLVNGYNFKNLVYGDSIFYEKALEGIKLISGSDNKDFSVDINEGLYQFKLNKGDSLMIYNYYYDTESVSYKGVIELSEKTVSPVPIKICNKEQFFYGIINKGKEERVNQRDINGPQLSKNTNFKFTFSKLVNEGNTYCKVNSCEYFGYQNVNGGALVAWCDYTNLKIEVIDAADVNMKFSGNEWISSSTGKVKLYPFEIVNFLQLSDSFKVDVIEGFIFKDEVNEVRRVIVKADSFFVGDDTNGYQIKPSDNQAELGGINNYLIVYLSGGDIIYNFNKGTPTKEKLKFKEDGKSYDLWFNLSKLDFTVCCKNWDQSKKDVWKNFYFKCSVSESIKGRLFGKNYIEYSHGDDCEDKEEEEMVDATTHTEEVNVEGPAATTTTVGGTVATGAIEAKKDATSGSCSENTDSQGKSYSCQCGMRAYDSSGSIIGISDVGMWTQSECEKDGECKVGLCNGADKYYYCCSDATANRKSDAKKGSDLMNQVITAWNTKKSVPGVAGDSASVCVKDGSIIGTCFAGETCTYDSWALDTSEVKCIQSKDVKRYCIKNQQILEECTSSEVCTYDEDGAPICTIYGTNVGQTTSYGESCNTIGEYTCRNDNALMVCADTITGEVSNIVGDDMSYSMSVSTSTYSLKWWKSSEVSNSRDRHSCSDNCNANICYKGAGVTDWNKCCTSFSYVGGYVTELGSCNKEGEYACMSSSNRAVCTQKVTGGYEWKLYDLATSSACENGCDANKCYSGASVTNPEDCCKTFVKRPCDTSRSSGQFVFSHNELYACYLSGGKYYPSTCVDERWVQSTACTPNQYCNVANTDVWCSDTSDSRATESVTAFEIVDVCEEEGSYACSDDKRHVLQCTLQEDGSFNWDEESPVKDCTRDEVCEPSYCGTARTEDECCFTKEEVDLSEVSEETDKCVYEYRNPECSSDCKGVLSCGLAGSYEGITGEIVMSCDYNSETRDFRWQNAGVCDIKKGVYCKQSSCTYGQSTDDCCYSRNPAPSTTTWSVFKADTEKVFNFFFA